MFIGQIVKKCLIPAAAVVVEAKVSSPQKEDNRCRPSELPIYTPETPYKSVTNETVDETPGVIENAFRTTRQTITKYTNEFNAYKRVGIEHLNSSKENVEWLVNYLQEEDNTMPKAGAIGIGALTGLIFGLRGGFFKRTLYATTGALGMAAVCYPKEAAEYSQVGISEAKKYLTIAYNFAYGVKKDDPPLELPSLPKIPTSLSEAWDSVKSTTTSFVSDKEDKAGETIQVIQEQVISTEPDDSIQIIDPLEVITESHSTSLSTSCHCPIGACLTHSDENPNPVQQDEPQEIKATSGDVAAEDVPKPS